MSLNVCCFLDLKKKKKTFLIRGLIIGEGTRREEGHQTDGESPVPARGAGG